MTLCTKSAILSGGCGSLSALEKHLPGIFVRRVEEPAQSLVPRRVELPQFESPLLTWEDQADEHNLDYVDKFELLVHQGLDACLESGQLSFLPHDRPVSFQEASRVGGPDQNSGAATHSGSRARLTESRFCYKIL